MTNITEITDEERAMTMASGTNATISGDASAGERTFDVKADPSRAANESGTTHSAIPTSLELADVLEASEGLDENIQLKLGQQLKTLFDKVATAPIPEEILDLVAALKQGE